MGACATITTPGFNLRDDTTRTGNEPYWTSTQLIREGGGFGRFWYFLGLRTRSGWSVTYCGCKKLYSPIYYLHNIISTATLLCTSIVTYLNSTKDWISLSLSRYHVLSWAVDLFRGPAIQHNYYTVHVEYDNKASSEARYNLPVFRSFAVQTKLLPDLSIIPNIRQIVRLTGGWFRRKNGLYCLSTLFAFYMHSISHASGHSGLTLSEVKHSPSLSVSLFGLGSAGDSTGQERRAARLCSVVFQNLSKYITFLLGDGFPNGGRTIRNLDEDRSDSRE